LSFTVYSAVYSVYNLQRNAVSFQQRFPCSSFAELAELLGVFVGEATIKGDRFESVDTAT
jgi:hypothetical protein